MRRLLLYAACGFASFAILTVIYDFPPIQTNVVQVIDIEKQNSVEVDYSENLSFERIEQWYAEQKNKPKFDDKLQIYAAGDIMLGRHVRTLMDRHGMDYPFEKIRDFHKEQFARVDVVHANLEGPILGAGKKGGTSMNFSFNEDVVEHLKKHGFTLLSLANNHSYDQGVAGFENTIEKLDNANIGWCGDARNENEEAVYKGREQDFDYAFLCFEDVNDSINLQAANDLIGKYARDVDFVIVSVHWGIEYEHTARPYIQEMAHGFVDSGAAVVIGHHPHVVQNFEIYKDRFIFYSLGNYVFDQYWANKVQEQMAIRLELWEEDGQQRSNVEIFPMKSEMSQIRLMDEEEKKDWVERFIGFGNYSEGQKNEIRQLKLAI